MRFKLLRRRLTISAPRMAVRSAMPWPLRWAGVAIVWVLVAVLHGGRASLAKRPEGGAEARRPARDHGDSILEAEQLSQVIHASLLGCHGAGNPFATRS